MESDVWLRSDRLGVVGKADRVEGYRGQHAVEWVPVESKRSRRRSFEADCVQLCAQAMALEEMRGTTVRRGFLYYVRQRRRLEVMLDALLRERTVAAAAAYHSLVSEGRMPPARYDARCRDCSMRAICLPRVTEEIDHVRRYLRRIAETEM